MGNITSSNDSVDNKKRPSILKLRRQSNRSIAGLSHINSSAASSATTQMTSSESSPTISSTPNSSFEDVSHSHRQHHHNHKNCYSLLKRLKHSKPLQRSESVHRSTAHRRDLSNSGSSVSPPPLFSRSHPSLHLQRSPSTASTSLYYNTSTTTNTINTNSTTTSTNNDYPFIQKYTDSQMALLNNHEKYNKLKRNKSLAGPYYDNSTQLATSTTTSESNNTTAVVSSPTSAATNHNADDSKNDKNFPSAAYDDIVNVTIDNYSSELLLKELYMLYETSPERRRDRDRRHRQHYLLKRTWGKNYKIPLNNPSLIIDWCCATAVWDLELAFEFPKATVVGIDYESVTVSSLTNTVKNFIFQNAMIHQGETGLERFEDEQVDYLMMRDVWIINTPAHKWESLFKQIYRILKPGGYIEIYEQDINYNSIGPNFTTLEAWSDRFYQAIRLDRGTNNKLGAYLQEAGFVKLVEESIELPVGEWPESKEMKETGFLQRDIIERRYRENKRWYCRFNNLSEKEYTTTLINAIDECDDYNTTVRSLYYSAQKPM